MFQSDTDNKGDTVGKKGDMGPVLPRTLKKCPFCHCIHWIESGVCPQCGRNGGEA